MTAIKKFNRYCEQMAKLHDPEWGIPLPEPLPLTLDQLRNNSLLMEDVWITRSPGMIPPWLEDSNIRAGIRAMLQLDHCIEERWRLGVEADNLCRWFGRDLLATTIAIVLPMSKPLLANTKYGSHFYTDEPLQQLLVSHRNELLALKSRWAGVLASESRFDAHVCTATEMSNCVTGSTQAPVPITWLQPRVDVIPGQRGVSAATPQDTDSDSESENDFIEEDINQTDNDDILPESLDDGDIPANLDVAHYEEVTPHVEVLSSPLVSPSLFQIAINFTIF